METEGIGAVLERWRSGGEPLPQEELVAMLREIQEVLGCIPEGVREAAAQAAGVKKTTVDAVVKLYPSLKAAPYRHCITVCRGGRCGPKGSGEVLEEFKRLLSVGKDGISQDGQFLVRTADCMKRCGTAPNVEIDGVNYPAVRPKDAERIIRNLRDKEENGK